MSTVFNPQWNRMMEVDTDLMKRLSSNNFAPVHTGGGCMAWERATDDKGYIWITDSSGAELGTWSARYEAEWIIGRYNGAGDFVCIYALTLTQALKLADTLRAPAEGESATFFGSI